LNLNIIKKRIEEHPYVAKAEVKSDGRGNVEVRIKEKDIYAVLLSRTEPFFLTNDFELLKIHEFTTYSDIPVISNFRLSEKLIPAKVYRSEDILDAFRIIDAAKSRILNCKKLQYKFKRRCCSNFFWNQLPVVFGRGRSKK
jgi:hypothetical protein